MMIIVFIALSIIYYFIRFPITVGPRAEENVLWFEDLLGTHTQKTIITNATKKLQEGGIVGMNASSCRRISYIYIYVLI